MTSPIRSVLTIAGSDSGGGAGIQADLKTFAAWGVYGTSAVTAITAQNTIGVTAVEPLAADLVTAQIEAVAGDIALHATKTGMLATAAIVEAVAAAIEDLDLPNVVVDPVMVAKSGDRLLSPDAIEMVRVELLPHARVVTPNIPEAEALSGRLIGSLDAAREAARAIHALGARTVVLKGGHAAGGEIVDLLFDGERFTEFRTPRINTVNTHGTGCTFASAIAAALALGRSVHDATELAQAYVAGAIRHSLAIGHGHGPLNHFWQGDKRVTVASRYTDLVAVPLLSVGVEPLDIEPLIGAVSDRGADTGADGAVAAFLGLVRNHNAGRVVRYLEYEGYEALAIRAFERIAAEVQDRWPGVRLALHHRLGRIDIGQPSVAIAAASAHRADAFAACRFTIERVKQIAPIWKREFFEGGDVWIEGATADPDDERARAEAERVACA